MWRTDLLDPSPDARDHLWCDPVYCRAGWQRFRTGFSNWPGFKESKAWCPTIHSKRYRCHQTHVRGLYLRRDIVHQNTIMTVPENSYYVLGDNAEYSDDSRYWEDPFVSHEDVIAKLLLPESEERNSGILCASLVGDAHKERSSGLNCTGRPFFRLAVQSPMDECL